MVEWRTKPRLDSGSGAGFQLIVVGYGVILITVFPADLADLRSNGIPGLLHLLLAATMIVVSWMGYYSNRQRYPVWHGEFFNIPLLQYLISFTILFLYWGLGITQCRLAYFDHAAVLIRTGLARRMVAGPSCRMFLSPGFLTR